MKLKSLAFAVAFLALLAGAAYLANRPESPPPADPRVGKPVLDSDSAARAAKLVVADQGKSVRLSRQSDGSWSVADYFGLPGDFSKISRFVSDLNEAKINRFVTANPGRIARLGFGDSAIRLIDAQGREIWSVSLGKNQDAGGGRFVRFGTDPKVFLAALNVWLDTDPKSWADAQLLNLKADDVAKVELPLDAGGDVAVARKSKAAPWAPADPAEKRKAKSDAISSALSTLGALRFSETTGPADAGVADARAHLKTYRLTMFDGKTLSIALGRKPEGKKPKPPAAGAKPGLPEFETIPAGPWYVFITASDPQAAINDLMKKRAFQIEDYSISTLPKSRDDVLETPAAPTVPAPSKK